MKTALFVFAVVSSGLLCVSTARAQEQFPIMDRVADRVIQKYQTESCPQIAASRDQPKSPEEQRVIQLLHDDPQMRRAFIDRVAAPIANKLFECHMLP